MNDTWSTPSEMLSWLDKATPTEIFTKALKCEDTQNALTMCDHILLKSDDDRLMQARTRFLKGKLFLIVDPSKSISQFDAGLSSAEGIISQDDPEVIEARALLNSLRPSDPDWELVSEYQDKISEFQSELYHQLGEDKADDVFYHDVALGWRIISLIQAFDNHVQMEGIALYFANTLGNEGEAIVEAFENVDKTLGAIVKEAFTIFDQYKDQHVEAATSELPMYSIVEAGVAPGMFEGVFEAYKPVESKYFDKAEELTALLATYIRNHQAEFPNLPQI